MGAGASVQGAAIEWQGLNEHQHHKITECSLKGLPGAIEEALYVRERWPLIVDPDGQATRFLRYQRGAFLMADKREDIDKKNLRARLVGSLMHGGNFCAVFDSLVGANFREMFDDAHFPETVLDRRRIFLEETWCKLLRPDKGDPAPDLFMPRDDFAFILVVRKDEQLPVEAAARLAVIKVHDGDNSKKSDCDKETQEEEELAGLFGAAEVKRNSTQMVEAAFDGELDEVKKWLDKGFHIESTDGRGHTSLSEAASQGHEDIIRLLLSEGADPNALNDVGRSSVWRASYNGHLGAVTLLLEAGADVSFRDKTSHEAPYDVARTNEVRAALDEWDPEVTVRLREDRKIKMRERAEERLTTAAERDQLARSIVRDELIEKAAAGDARALKGQLIDLADDAELTGQRPRGTCEVRDSRGMTLLSLAAQHGRLEVMELLLTHWKACDDDKVGLTPGIGSWERRVFKANVNSRDLKGWNPAAIAVFHDSKAALALLLTHGADPYLKSSYNKSAWDLAQDELDAATRVVRSRAEIRGVVDAWALETGQQGHLPGQASGGKAIGANGVPIGQPKDGTATMLAIEVAKGSQGSGKGRAKGPKSASKSASKSPAGSAKKPTGGKKKAAR